MARKPVACVCCGKRVKMFEALCKKCAKERKAILDALR